MNYSQRRFARSGILLAAVLLSVALSGARGAEPAPPMSPPALPAPQSPIAHFRHLLALSPSELETALRSQPESRRATLEAKVAEYKSLTPDQRERRLQHLELRLYLLPLLPVPKSERTNRLARVPSDARSLVEVRLHEWDRLHRDLQQEVLSNERIVRYFLRAETSPGRGHTAFLTADDLRQLDEWNAYSAAQREEIYRNFQRFFTLPEQERTVAVRALGPEMTSQIRGFEMLSPEDRHRSIESIQRFINLTPEDQASFLAGANLWREMSPDERRTWREVVRALKPAEPPTHPAPPIPTPSITPPPAGASNPPPDLPGSDPTPKNQPPRRQ